MSKNKNNPSEKDISSQADLKDELKRSKKLVHDLRRQIKMHKTLLDHLPDYIYAKDKDGRFLIANCLVYEDAGFKSEKEILGKTDFDMFPKHLCEQYRKDELAIMNSGISQINREEEYVNHKGENKWVLSNKVPYLDSKGNLIGLLGLNRDFTELKHLRDREREHMDVMKDELAYGREIQKGFIPKDIIQPQGWDIASCFLPAREVSGDFFDVFKLDEDNLIFVVADVCGKGVSAAIFVSLIQTLIRVYSEKSKNEKKDPLECISIVSDYIASHYNHFGKKEGFKSSKIMFATLFIGLVNVRSGVLRYINAGHELPFLVRNKKNVDWTVPENPSVGITENSIYKISEFQMEPDDTLIIVTDGVTDTKNKKDEFFTTQKIREFVEEDFSSPDELLTKLESNLVKFREGAPQFDDITMLAVKRQ